MYASQFPISQFSNSFSQDTVIGNAVAEDDIVVANTPIPEQAEDNTGALDITTSTRKSK